MSEIQSTQYCVECERLAAERDKEAGRWLILSSRLIDAEAKRDRYRTALQRIAVVNRDKRPDGSYNHDRNALIDIAEDALKGGSDE